MDVGVDVGGVPGVEKGRRDWGSEQARSPGKRPGRTWPWTTDRSSMEHGTWRLSLHCAGNKTPSPPALVLHALLSAALQRLRWPCLGFFVFPSSGILSVASRGPVLGHASDPSNAGGCSVIRPGVDAALPNLRLARCRCHVPSRLAPAERVEGPDLESHSAKSRMRGECD